jgi:hypothetical protein
MAAKKSSERQAEGPKEFARFDELTRKLIKVPKDQLDEKVKKPKPSPPSTRRT